MAAPIFAGMAGFADNFTRAYTGERRRQSDEEDRKAEREWRAEQRGRQRKEWEEADQLKTDLKDAGAVRTEVQGTMTESMAGGVMQRGFNKDPEEALRVKAIMDAEAEMTGAAPATQTQTTAVTGNMARGHQIGQTMGAMGADPNSTEAVAQRTAAAYRKNGQFEKAMQMENAIMDQQAKRLGMSIDQLKFADMQTNRALESALKSGPTWYEGAAKFATETKRGGMDGITVEPVVSADGKTVTMRAKMPDGTAKDAGTYPTDDSGMLQFSRQFAALPIEKRMDIMADKLRQDKEDARKDRQEAKEDSRWQQTFDFNKKKDEDDRQYKNRVLGFQAAQDKRQAETHQIAMADAKIPAAVKLRAAAISDELKSISAAMNKAMAEGSFSPESANAKTLIERQAALGIQYRQLLEPHMPAGKGGPAAADPLGIDKPAAGAPAAPAAAPGAQQATPAQTVAPPAPPAATAAPRTPPPTMAEIQAQTRANRALIVQRGELEKKAEQDPEIQTLRQQHAQAIRAGKPMEANAIMAQITEVKAQRYSVK
jgi:hypothetical protein